MIVQNVTNTGGLNLENTMAALEAQIPRTKAKFQKNAAFCGIVAGIAAAITVLVLSILCVVHFSSITVPRIVDGKAVLNRLGKPITDLAHPGKFFISVFSAPFGTVGVGFAIGFGVYGLGIWMGNRKIKEIAQFKLGLANKYELKGIVSVKDIKRIVEKADREILSALVAKMNFEQLFSVKKEVSDGTFQELITPITDQKAHWQWKFVLSLSKEKNVEKILENLSKLSIKNNIKSNPFLVKAIAEQLKHIKDERIAKWIQENQLPLFVKKEGSNLPLSKELGCLIVGGNSITVDKSLLAEKSPYFQKLFYGNFKERNQEAIKLDGYSYDTYKLFIDIMQGEPVQLNKENVQDLLKLSDYASPLLTHSLGRFIIAHRHLYSTEELVAIVNQFPTCTIVKTYLEKKWLSKKITEKNFQRYFEFANIINSEELRRKCNRAF